MDLSPLKVVLLLNLLFLSGCFSDNSTNNTTDTQPGLHEEGAVRVINFYETPTPEQIDAVLGLIDCEQEELKKSQIIDSNCTYNYDAQLAPDSLYVWCNLEIAQEIAKRNFVKSIEVVPEVEI